MREITKQTGADIKSWTEKPDSKSTRARPTRTFVVEVCTDTQHTVSVIPCDHGQGQAGLPLLTASALQSALHCSNTLSVCTSPNFFTISALYTPASPQSHLKTDICQASTNAPQPFTDGTSTLLQRCLHPSPMLPSPVTNGTFNLLQCCLHPSPLPSSSFTTIVINAICHCSLTLHHYLHHHLQLLIETIPDPMRLRNSGVPACLSISQQHHGGMM